MRLLRNFVKTYFVIAIEQSDRSVCAKHRPTLANPKKVANKSFGFFAFFVKDLRITKE
mgnify:CR=1 FL=1